MTNERTKNMRIVDWNPADGQCFQGDVVLMALPDGMALDTSDEMAPHNGRLILAAGEMTGHHHAIGLRAATMFHDEALARSMEAAAAPKPAAGPARMYRDANAANALREAGHITRTDLCLGFLTVEGAPVVLRHEEHDGIRIPPGRYYVGAQIESAGAEERRVID